MNGKRGRKFGQIENSLGHVIKAPREFVFSFPNGDIFGYSFTTFSACGPRSPSTMSNDTSSPSLSVLNPSD